MNTIGKRVKNLRIALQITQANLAKKVGVSPAQISHIEKDRHKGVSNRTMSNLAIALGRPLNYLLSGTEKEESVVESSEKFKEDEEAHALLYYFSSLPPKLKELTISFTKTLSSIN